MSTRNDTFFKSNIEETNNLYDNANVCNMDVNIDYGAQMHTTAPEQKKVIPPEVLNKESIMEEVEILYITLNLSNKDTNVNMGEGFTLSKQQLQQQ